MQRVDHNEFAALAEGRGGGRARSARSPIAIIYVQVDRHHEYAVAISTDEYGRVICRGLWHVRKAAEWSVLRDFAGGRMLQAFAQCQYQPRAKLSICEPLSTAPRPAFTCSKRQERVGRVSVRKHDFCANGECRQSRRDGHRCD